MSVVSAKTRQLVRERDNGLCRRCGKPGNNVHHRISRGMGGSSRDDVNGLAALVTLCGSGVTGCHGYITEHPEYAYNTGWSIRRSESDVPESISMWDLRLREFFLIDDGGVIYIRRETTKQ